MLQTSSPLHPFRALRPGLVALLLGLLLGLDAPVGAQSLIQHVAGPDGTKFGASVAVIDDLDGDGFLDFAVGEYHDDTGGTDAGEVNVISGRTGAVLHALIGNSAQDWFGKTVEAPGDLDGDGLGDLLVAAPRDTFAGKAFAGVVTAYSSAGWGVIWQVGGSVLGASWGHQVHAIPDVTGDGRKDVLVASEDELANNQGRARLYSGATAGILHTWDGLPGESFGVPCGHAGDIDGDGVADVLINVHAENGVFNQYRLRAYSGADASLLHSWSNIKASAVAIFNNGDGPTTAALGDVDGDGRDDFAVQHLGPVAGFPEGGVVYVVSGMDKSILATYGGSGEQQSFGHSIAGTGDLDGDGVPDMVVGAPQATGPGTFSGYVRAISLGTGTELYTVGATSANDRFGEAIRAAGDVDGDGLNDVIVGAPRSGGMNLPGYVKVLSGKCGGTWAGYGAGLAGSGGLLPTLTGEGCPGLGLTPKARIANALGGATAWVVGGPAPAALAFKGGTLLVDPVIALIVPLPLSGPAGVPGAGTLVLTIPLPDLPIYLGVTLRLQTLVPDAAAPAGWAMTAGLEMTIG
jgi:hypothetical protein